MDFEPKELDVIQHALEVVAARHRGYAGQSGGARGDCFLDQADFIETIIAKIQRIRRT